MTQKATNSQASELTRVAALLVWWWISYLKSHTETIFNKKADVVSPVCFIAVFLTHFPPRCLISLQILSTFQTITSGPLNRKWAPFASIQIVQRSWIMSFFSFHFSRGRRWASWLLKWRLGGDGSYFKNNGTFLTSGMHLCLRTTYLEA